MAKAQHPVFDVQAVIDANREFARSQIEKDTKCPAPDANAEDKKSSAIGEPLQSGQDALAVLIQLQKHSEMMFDHMHAQTTSIKELTMGMEYLAQQVKTLVDALAEDADPDQPITNYLSGKPI